MLEENVLYIGLDVGSTTVKVVVIDKDKNIIYKSYERHRSNVRQGIYLGLKSCFEKIGNMYVKLTITGSGGLSIAKQIGADFQQEVVACSKAVKTFIPETDVAIELGGEDAKITYFGQQVDQRMNGACAGGTGAFIDQMAVLLHTDAEGLNKLAKNHETIYPIASRCGVFAKTDIQPLLNQGASKDDVAASIFQAVVNQTISGLACGKPIKGKVAFLGGPLHFLSELRERFIETLKLNEETAIIPKDAQFFVALGSGILALEKGRSAEIISELLLRVERLVIEDNQETKSLRPLFLDDYDYSDFVERHSQAKVGRKSIEIAEGYCFLGIDAGSTTTKLVLIDEEGCILFSKYATNQGDPLAVCKNILKEMYSVLPENLVVANSVVTGYGEEYIKSGFSVDIGEVETIAHFRAAKSFLPDVNFILDIGGQDMKAIKIRDEAVDDILLNEACSSGCGSFIDTFAQSVGISVSDFASMGVRAKNPVDLGNRCTVFMNSKVKQAQKEGAELGDIAAGLSFAVIRNALYKVIKLRNVESLGSKILVQGGTFLNDSVLRAFELETGVNVIRPDISGLMGAYGAALIACDRFDGVNKSSLVKKADLKGVSYGATTRRCGGCTNNCKLTVMKFSNGKQFISGNRCSIGQGKTEGLSQDLNMIEYKRRRIFDYEPLSDDEAYRGKVGIPRALNMYENYPFWYTFFTGLGFQVILSDESSKEIFEKGIESIPSEAVCYPAKLVHGHVVDLIDKGIDFIFYPCVIYEFKEFSNSRNNYNCPVVAGYPEVIKNNLELIRERNINFVQPFVTMDVKGKLISSLYKALAHFGIGNEEIELAVEEAYIERDKVKEDIRKKADSIMAYCISGNLSAAVVCGRPYHVDPEINHGLANIILEEGMAVLTEDSVIHMGSVKEKLNVVDQWTYHSRLYNAASVVAKNPSMELIQLTSFGCGLDAITADQVAEILRDNDRVYTLIKIDEGSNLGAIKIRIRSLKAVIEERRLKKNWGKGSEGIINLELINRQVKRGKRKLEKLRSTFTKEMRKTHTILIPQLSPIHFQFLEEAFKATRYNVEVLEITDKNSIDEGLKYVNNDACYPCIITTGQIVNALKSGKYDTNRVAILMSQTGGPCRATNYVEFIRRALKDAKLEYVPVIGLSAQGIEKHSGFVFSWSLIRRIYMAINYGDILMKVLYRTRPYENEKGSVERLYNYWVEKCKNSLNYANPLIFAKNNRLIVKDFDNLPTLDVIKPKVGVVGEILVKFHPYANNKIVDIIEEEGGEAVVPGLLEFLEYCAYNNKFKKEFLQGSKVTAAVGGIIVTLLEAGRKPMIKALGKSKKFEKPLSIKKLAGLAKGIVSEGNQSGEGWFLTAEMIELIDNGVKNIVCLQPFACLPNHITGRGVIKELKRKYPDANIVAVDYDPGASESNQLNRIKLMMSVAHENLE
ncbi:MAG: acyl-CoA dehydratase activase-related protein [Filifactoraceae bacterium]